MARRFYFGSGLFLFLVTGAGGGSLWAWSKVGIVPRFFFDVWPGDKKIAQGLYLLMIAISFLLFCRGFRGVRSIGTGALLALAAPVLLLISAAWSFDPEATIRRGVEYLFVVLGGVAIAGSLEGDEFMHLFFLTTCVSVISSIALRHFQPDLAMQDFTAMRGIFPHKNVFGEVMSIGTLTCLHGLRTRNGGRLWYGGALIVFLILALASKSATGYVSAFAYCGADCLVTLYRKRGIARVIGLTLVALGVPIVLMVLFFPDAFFEAIGKDPTLTGRTELWAYVLAAIDQRPLLGWGYWGFWSPENPVAAEISDVVQWTVPEAHNALLELLLNVGFLGTTFFIFLLLRNVWFALQCMRTRAAGLAITALLCYCGLTMMGVSEALLMDPFQPMTLMFFTTGLLCEKAVRSAQRTQRSVIRQPYRAGRVRDPTSLSSPDVRSRPT